MLPPARVGQSQIVVFPFLEKHTGKRRPALSYRRLERCLKCLRSDVRVVCPQLVQRDVNEAFEVLVLPVL